MATGLPLNAGAADATELAKMSKHEGPAVLYGRAAPTAPKGRRPATKRKAGQQGRIGPAVASKGVVSTERASAGALYAEEECLLNTTAPGQQGRVSGQALPGETLRKTGAVEQQQS